MRNQILCSFMFVSLFFMVFAAVAVAQDPDVTLNNSISWDTVNGAAGYQVRLLDATNAQFFPATGVYDNGLATVFALNIALTGATVNVIYKFQVRAVEAGGANPTSWSQLSVNYIGLAAPTNLQVVMYVSHPLLGFYACENEYRSPCRKLAA